MSERALFVLNKDGVVHWSSLSPVGGSPGADGILSALESLGARTDSAVGRRPATASPAAERDAAEVAEAAGAHGKYWQNDTLFEHQDALGDRALVSYAAATGLDAAGVRADLTAGSYADRVRPDFLEGVRSGVNGTPTLFVSGERHDGDWTDEAEFVAALAAVASR